jgi:HAE1 family hydrophobic/amphiphilic exporter-1
LQERLASFDIPSGYRVEFGGEQQETEETFLELFRSMGLAVILILLILVIEFNSYSQPLLIFVSIPLALAGVLIGLFIFGGQLNFSAFIGLVSLTGIVVNNAILLVDRMNKLRGQSHSDAHAVLVAVQTRLRPVILTTLTTSLGVMPLIWVDEFFRDLALTLITGLIFSTVLTLVLIPILYLRLQNQLDKRMASRSIAQTPANTV